MRCNTDQETFSEPVEVMTLPRKRKILCLFPITIRNTSHALSSNFSSNFSKCSYIFMPLYPLCPDCD